MPPAAKPIRAAAEEPVEVGVPGEEEEEGCPRKEDRRRGRGMVRRWCWRV